VSEREAALRARLETALAPEVVAALLELVDERAGAVPTAELPSPWLTLGEGADYMRVSARTLERLIARGRVRSTCTRAREAGGHPVTFCVLDVEGRG
jgi:excisionase family DNA binding protein